MSQELEIPADILSALCRLNNHARAFGFGRNAIYAYKAAVAAAAATEAKPVCLGVKCRHCDGTGIWNDWHERYSAKCRKCEGKGIAVLRFVETTIGSVRWAHPYGASGRGANSGQDVLKAVWDIRDYRYPDSGPVICVLGDGTERPLSWWESPGDWGPNMPGAEKLLANDAVKLLNLVEGRIIIAQPARKRAVWPWRRAIDEIGRYQLDLERIDEGACWRCGAEDSLRSSRVARSTQYLTFARPICDACYALDNQSVWPTEPHPASVTRDVLAWLAHSERQKPFQARREDER